MSVRKTRKVELGSCVIGSGAPVTIQTMTNLPLADVRGTLEQIDRCAALGCDIVRGAVDDEKAEKALGWKREISFAELVNRMVDNDMALVEKEIKISKAIG